MTENNVTVSSFRPQSDIDPQEEQSITKNQDELQYYKQYCQQLEKQNATLNAQLFQNLQNSVKPSENEKIIKNLKQQLKQKQAEEQIWTKRYEEQLNQIITLRSKNNVNLSENNNNPKQQQQQFIQQQCVKNRSISPQFREDNDLKNQIRQQHQLIQAQEDQIQNLNKKLQEYSHIKADFQTFNQSELNQIHQQLQESDDCITEMRNQISFKDNLIQESIRKYENLLKQFEIQQNLIIDKNKEIEQLKLSQENLNTKSPSNGFANNQKQLDLKINITKFRENRIDRLQTEPDILSSKSFSNFMVRDT